jgi:hypothetical protein
MTRPRRRRNIILGTQRDAKPRIIQREIKNRTSTPTNDVRDIVKIKAHRFM